MPVPNNTFAAKLCPFLMRYIRNMPMMRFMVGSMLFMKKKKIGILLQRTYRNSRVF